MRRSGVLRRKSAWIIVSLVVLAVTTATASAAVMVPNGGERYVLEQGQVIQDDLYVSAGEIIINGVVEGDLVATAAYIEVNGVVKDDMLAAAASVVINGVIEDDARVGGAAVDIRGAIGSDLVAAAGGGEGFAYAFPVGDRSLVPGLRIGSGATIGQDALLAAGSTTLDGVVGRNLYAAAGNFALNGVVQGDATLYVGSLSVSDSASVGGVLTYSADEALNIPSTVASRVEVMPTRPSDAQPAQPRSMDILGWLIGTAFLLVGLALLGWLLIRFAPGLLAQPTAAIAEKPVQAFIIGLVVFLLILPVSALLMATTAIFFGLFPAGFAMLFFLFGALVLLWVFSPMAPGLWIGRMISRGHWSDVLALLVGVVIIALAARLIAWIPCTGPTVAFLIYLVCFSFTVGGLYLAQRRQVTGPVDAEMSEDPAAMA